MTTFVGVEPSPLPHGNSHPDVASMVVKTLISSIAIAITILCRKKHCFIEV